MILISKSLAELILSVVEGSIRFNLKNSDRWGNLIFTNEQLLINEPSFSWNGLNNNKEVDIGVYVYLIKITDGTTSMISSGDITLLR